MIELKEMTIERNDYNSYDGRYYQNPNHIYYEGITINFELNAPSNLDIYEFQRKFQQLIDMENRELNKRQFLRGGEFECSLTMPRANRYNILKIYHNKEKSTTVVCFDYSIQEIFGLDMEESKSKIKVKRDSEDSDDIYMAVASAVMIRKYKSNSQFKAHIRRSIPNGFDGRPYVYQLMAAAEVSDIYGSWEKFCKIVDEKLEVYHG